MADEHAHVRLRLRASTLRHKAAQGEQDAQNSGSPKRHRVGSSPRHLHRPNAWGSKPTASVIYEGSFRAGSSLDQGLLPASGYITPRTSVSHLQLKPLLAGLGQNTDSYGLHEFRDGLFDATFVRPADFDPDNTFSESLKPPESAKFNLYGQLKQLQEVIIDVTSTRIGVRLLKSFLGFWICYILCLIPLTRQWLGPYNYLIVVSAIVNHPGRSIGSQIDGTIFTCIGSVFGLLWASFATWLSSASSASQQGFGAVVAPFFILFTLILGWLRCVYGRLYQCIVAAGIAFFYMTLSQDYTNTAIFSSVITSRIISFMVPWAIGQGICLVVCCCLFPSAGNRPWAVALHTALDVARQSLVLPRPESAALNRLLAFHFVNISQAARDFNLDLTFSPFSSKDCIEYRNRLQAVLRAMLALRPSSGQFQETRERVEPSNNAEDPADCVNRILAAPTWNLVELCQVAIDEVDHIVMSTAGFSQAFDVKSFSDDKIKATLHQLKEACNVYDTAERSLRQEPALLSIDSKHAEVVALFLFMHPIRQAADKVLNLLAMSTTFMESSRSWKFHLPSYPWSKAFFRMNPNVRHDRGGLTAAYYFGSKRQLERTMRGLQNRTWAPLQRYSSKEEWEEKDSNETANSSNPKTGPYVHFQAAKRRWLRTLWSITHRLQDFESRFALKKTIVCTLLSLPAFLPQSSLWWYNHDCWWVVATVWMMMHPRVGGNLSDVAIRGSCAAIGAVWGGFAFAAGDGNPFVMAAFALLFGVPMLYRYTISSHPRSGVIGCLSFTVVSLIINTHNGQLSVVYLAWTRGLLFVVGVLVAIFVNWVFWPFVARHELRKSLATMLLHSALVYRRILAIYIYHKEEDAPTPEDIAMSEMIEGRVREGFVRVRQLMALTKHEIRLRGPFNPRPYAALIGTCEVLFDRLIDVRQAAIFSNLRLMHRTDNTAHNLFVLRRDAVASMLIIIYVLAGALRERRPLPRYLPSAALSRQRLLDAMDRIDAEAAQQRDGNDKDSGAQSNWDNIYRYAFSSAITECVEQVQRLVGLTRLLVGEVTSLQLESEPPLTETALPEDHTNQEVAEGP